MKLHYYSSFIVIFFLFIHQSYAQIGSIDSSFNPIDDGSEISQKLIFTQVNALEKQEDGKTLVAAQYMFFDLEPYANQGFRLRRFNPDGSTDFSFQASYFAFDFISALGLQSDGKINVGVSLNSDSGSSPSFRVQRLNSDGSIDNSFNQDPSFHLIKHIKVQTDGKILVASHNSNSSNNHGFKLSRLNENGTLDTSFEEAVFNFDINALLLQTDGKIVIGGSFTEMNNQSVSNILRLNSDGTFDTSFVIPTGEEYEIDFINTVNDVISLPNDQLLIAGRFNFHEEVNKPGILRYNQDLTLDKVFNLEGVSPNIQSSEINSLVALSNGEIITSGSFGSFFKKIIRFDEEGGYDDSYDASNYSSFEVNRIVVDDEDKLLVGGNFQTYRGIIVDHFMRLNYDGTLDQSYTYRAGLDREPYAMYAMEDDKIIIIGPFNVYNGEIRKRIAIIHPDGELDEDFIFDTDANIIPYHASVQSDGKVIVAVSISNTDSANGFLYKLIRLNTDGSIDESFDLDEGFNTLVTSTLILPNGKIIAMGNFNSLNGFEANRIISLNHDGTIDSTFDSGLGFNGFVRKAELLTDNKILVSGDFTSYNGVDRQFLAKLNLDGSLDTNFNPQLDFNSNSVTFDIQSDGKIIIIGEFTEVNNTVANRIIRLNPDGSIDTSFNSGSGFDDIAIDITCLEDDKIIVRGNFEIYDGQPIISIARLNSDGSLDTSFNPGESASVPSPVVMVTSHAVQSNGNIVIGGRFLTFDGQIRNRITRLLGDVNLSEQSFSLNKLSIYPNPTKGKFHLNGVSNNFKVSVYTTQGVEVYQTVISDGTQGVDISHLTNGLYLIKIDDSGREFTHKIIKE